jgi:hypothetical protein
MIERAKALPKSALSMPFSRGKILDELPAGSSSLKPLLSTLEEAQSRQYCENKIMEPGYV